MLARVTQAEQLAAQAAQWQAAGRADMAVQLYGASLEQDPSKFAVRMQLAECLVYIGQPDQAAENYLMVAQAYAARGRQQECLAICERIIAVAPHAFVYMSVGPMVRRIGRHARTICAKAAEAHLSAGRQTDGLQILRLGAELDPQNPDVRLRLSRIYLSRHMNREAVESLSDAGNLLIQAKRYTDYIEVAEQILAIEPHDIQTLRDLPRVYLELNKPHEAVRTLGLLTKASPGDIIGYEILAQAFASIGRTDKSLSVLERLVDELGSTGQADPADAILNHARYWRPTDLGFLRSLKRMEVPRNQPAPRPHDAEQKPTKEGTVVLSIADLLVDENSTRSPAPGTANDGIELTEAEGTLTLRIGDLILDEMQQAAGHGVSPPTLPPFSNAPPPPPPPPSAPPPAAQVPTGESTISLDGADLLEALVGAGAGATEADPWANATPTRPERMVDSGDLDEDAVTVPPPSQPAAQEESPATIALQRPLPGMAPGALPATIPPPGEDAPTMAPPGSAPSPMPEPVDAGPTLSSNPASTQSISSLIYDDEDEEESEPATLLHMKPLTAEDIARAQQGLPPASLGTPEPEPEPDMGDDAPTLHRMQPLTAEDIANAMAKQAAAKAEVNEDASTVPPPSRPAPLEQAPPPMVTPSGQAPPPMVAPSGQAPPPMVAPSNQAPPPMVAPPGQAPPPMVAPPGQAPPPMVAPDQAPPPMVSADGQAPPPLLPLDEEDEEEERTMMAMSALSPEDLARGSGSSGDSNR